MTENDIEFEVFSKKIKPDSDALYGITKIRETDYSTTFRGRSYFEQSKAFLEILDFYKSKLHSIKIGFDDTNITFWKKMLEGGERNG